jgi:hypothetical protein
LSIKVGGRTFRTLDDPIATNGAVTKEVYADGVKVYPEADDRLVKVTGNAMVRTSHSHSYDDEIFVKGGEWIDDDWYYRYPTETSEFSIDASFVAVVRGEGVAVRSRADLGDDISTVGAHAPTRGDDADFFKPLAEYSYRPSPLGLYVVGEPSSVKVAFRMEMSPVPCCGMADVSNRIRTIWTYYTHHDYKWYPLARPMQDGPDEFNGQVLRLSSLDTHGAEFDGRRGKVLLRPYRRSYRSGGDTGYYGLFSGFEAVASGYRHTFSQMYWNRGPSGQDRDVIPTTSMRTAVAKDFDLCKVPIMSVLYDGPAHDAPDEMFKARKSDLAKF